MSTSPILFDDFIPGHTLGESIEVFDDQQLRRWGTIFETSDTGANQGSSSAAASMAVVNMMRAYLHVVTPRPPGNMHARQVMKLGALPQHGETIRVVVRCADKFIKRERKHVELTVTGLGTGERQLFEGRLSLIWAA